MHAMHTDRIPTLLADRSKFAEPLKRFLATRLESDEFMKLDTKSPCDRQVPTCSNRSAPDRRR